jgi:hypothetical protein
VELIKPSGVLGFLKLVSLAFAGHLKVVMMRGLIQQALQVEKWKKDFGDCRLVSHSDVTTQMKVSEHLSPFDNEDTPRS